MLAIGRHCRKNQATLHHARKLLLWSLCTNDSQHGPTRIVRRNHACRRSLHSRSSFNVLCRRERRRLSQPLGKKIQHRTYRQSLSHSWVGPRLPDTGYSSQWQNGISRVHVYSSGRNERVCPQTIRRIFTGSPPEISIGRRKHHSYPHAQREDNHASIRHIHPTSLQPPSNSMRHTGIRPKIPCPLYRPRS